MMYNALMENTIAKFETGPFAVNTWVMPLDRKSTVIVDPGGICAELLEYLRQSDAAHLEIMLTHGHFDHIAGLPALIKEYPDYRLWIHEADAPYLGTQAKTYHLKSFTPLGAQYIVESLHDPLPAPTDFFADSETVNGFTILHTPGHTQGSVCLWNKASDILFSGDTLFYGSRGRTDLFDGNEANIQESLHKLFASLPCETKVYPGHGLTTSIGFEKQYQQ